MEAQRGSLLAKPDGSQVETWDMDELLAGMSKSQGCFGYPLSIFFIVANEFCERFSYYGMRGILILYFTNFFSWDDNMSTAIYHTFVALCYLTPILGALIADSWLGKFKTIVSLSIVYTIGQAVISVSSINDLTDHNHDGTPDSLPVHVALSMIGLALIALGTGGIKPCVSAFGGDQFEEGQLSATCWDAIGIWSKRFLPFQQCGIHSKQACYPLAFGVPAALMAVALIVFILGSGMYKKFQPQGNIMGKVAKCIHFAIKNRFRHRSKAFPKREHWLDWAKEKYDERLISQIKMVMRVMFLYIPLPMFWALFDQQGALEIQPDQMQTVNAILIVIMVPIFDAVLYPLIAKCGLNFTSLKKMTVGMFLASLAFVVAAIVQVEIDTNAYMTFDVNKLTSINISSPGSPVTAVTDDFKQGQRHTLLVWAPNHYRVVKDDLNQKPKKGENGIRFVNTFNELITVTMSGKIYANVSSNNASNYQFFPSGIKGFTISSTEIPPQCQPNFHTHYLEFGSAYTYLVRRKNGSCPEVRSFEDISANTVNMALQIPQYFLLTCGEVVFSVTGLEFSYSQAPSNMKSVLQAGWLLTVAIGNIIVLIVAGAGQFSKQRVYLIRELLSHPFHDFLHQVPAADVLMLCAYELQWAEYILFAALLLVVCIIFAIMTRFYTYINPAEIEAQFDEDEKKKSLENSNPYIMLGANSQTQM
ncbi:hypothetical protein EGM_08584 [Macaca fascicularis]|uniref:Solute carrier family 15 member 1 n=1 Tax=Macaca fascicularis TaxID=9541 RepID=G7PVM4_MACFA|nr:hypothetical protein EGM_08584 [Macaca fascicularis]